MRINGVPPKRTRPGKGAYAFVATLIALSAWMENGRIRPEGEVKRGLASVDRRPAANYSILSENITINPEGKNPGEYHVFIDFLVGANANLHLKDVTDVFAETACSNQLSKFVNPHCGGILETIRSNSERVKTSGGSVYNTSTWTVGYWGTISWIKAHSATKCTEETKDSRWIQTCSPVIASKAAIDDKSTEADASDIAREYKQVLDCAESPKGVRCLYKVDAVMNPKTLTGFMKTVAKGIGVTSTSANQNAYLLADSNYTDARVQIQLFEFQKPFEDHVKEAAKAYFKNEESFILDLRKSMPAKMDSPATSYKYPSN